jgi:hypothetical protein
MKAKELYRVLESEVGPWLKERDFKKRRASRLTLQRIVDGKYQSVWFQCDKYGWDSHAGGEFYVNFTVSESTDPEAGARRDERLNYFLTDLELERARQYRDEIVARIPKPPYSYFEDLQATWSKSVGPESAASLMQTVRDRFEPQSIPYRRNQDFSLRYWQPSDVVGWSALIRSVLPRAIDEMQSWALPPYGAKR